MNLNDFRPLFKSDLGTVLKMAYQGDLVTLVDGTKWICDTPDAMFAYTAEFEATPALFKSAGVVFKGPHNGFFMNRGYFHTQTLTYNPNNNMWMLSSSNFTQNEGDPTFGFFYYTSVDDGETWTQRQFPNNLCYSVYFVAGKFYGIGPNSATNGIIYSTDGITWTSVASTPNFSNAGAYELCSDGVNSIVAAGYGITPSAYSLDNGATWTSMTLTMPAGVGKPGRGQLVWAPSAGLFLAAANAAGNYHTSPTGETWITRNALLPWSGLSNIQLLFAASPTQVLAVMRDGHVFSSTDGVTWSGPVLMENGLADNNNVFPHLAYWDGAKFVVIYPDRAYTSADGVTWVKSVPLCLTPLTTAVVPNMFLRFEGGKCIRVPSSDGSGVKLLLFSDFLDTTPRTVVPPEMVFDQSMLRDYWRIK